MLHYDLMFRFTCPDCGQINAPILSIYEYETEGINKTPCVQCKRPFQIDWTMKVEAEIVDEPDIEIEPMLFQDDDEDEEQPWDDDDLEKGDIDDETL